MFLNGSLPLAAIPCDTNRDMNMPVSDSVERSENGSATVAARKRGPPKGSGGRPTTPLAEREGRYVFARLEAEAQKLSKERGLSEFRAYEEIARLMRADIVPAPGGITRVGPLGFSVVPADYREPKGKDKAKHADRKAEYYRYGNPDRALADDLRRTMRAFRQRRDSVWFLAMVAAWRLCIDGEVEKTEEARRLAESVGEHAYFDAEMLPDMHWWRAIRNLRENAGAAPLIFRPITFLPRTVA